MTENIKKLTELAQADEALVKRLAEAQDKEAVATIAAEAGITLTDADFEAIAAERKRIILDQGVEMLSDDELDAVAGGGKCKCFGGGFGAKSGETRRDVGYTLIVQDDPCICPIVGFGHTTYRYRKAFGGMVEYYEERCRCGAWGNGSAEV